VSRCGGPVAHFDTYIRTGQPSERALIGDVACRLDLKGHPGSPVDQRRQLDPQLLVQFLLGWGQVVHEADVELRAVATDQVRLGREPGQHRQVTQRPPGDHAVVVAGMAASDRRAVTDSGIGAARRGSATIGTRVPS
jgi:hypothetical protein